MTDKPSTESVKIRIGPDTWSGTLPLLIALLENGSAEGKRMAKTELQRMAKVADMTLEKESK
jgi:hypothetical protein